MTQGDKKRTKAERREDARRQRLEEIRRRKRKKRGRKIVMSIVALTLIGGLVAFAVISAQRGSKKSKDFLKNAVAAGCAGKFETPADQGRQHIGSPQTFNYNSKPPTSGNHYGSPDRTGIHTAPIQNETQVHNLEHGHVIISYKPDGLDQGLIDKLEDVSKSDDKRIIVAPYADMSHKVAMTAWGRLLGCDSPTDKVADVARDFADLYKGKGPEGDIPGTVG